MSPALTAAIIADIVFVAMIIFLIAGKRLSARKRHLVPAGFRPGPSDEELEKRFLVRQFAIGGIVTLFFAIFLPYYFIREPVRINQKEAKFLRESVDRGRQAWEAAGDPANLRALGCATCHGAEGEGGVRNFQGHTYAEPPIKWIVARYKAAGRNDEDIRLLIRDAIERGRPGTPMPTWGLQYGGPLHSQQVDDLMNFIYAIQEEAPDPKTTDGAALFQQNCAVCHGAKGEGGIGPNLQVAFDRLTEEEVKQTLEDGRLNTNRPSMPSWAYLGEDAIDALVSFLKSIQRGSAR